jgi:rare lipoprotein A
MGEGGGPARFWRAPVAAAALACTALLAGCGPFFDADGVKFSTAEYGVTASPRLTRSMRVRKGGGRYMVGKPYRVGGTWYTPTEDPDYQATGTASWYGSNFHGRLTANGEIYDMNGISGAHPTLPLPSYVRVANLENGRSIVVRVNDRGPYTHGRVIDVSEHAAQLLGFRQAGTARVHVEYVGPAPLEGDDTRALLASYSGPGVQSGTGAVLVASTTRRGLLGGLLSYADDAEPAVAELDPAVAAAAAQAAGVIDWHLYDGADSLMNVSLGVFADPEEAMRVALAFSPIAAVAVVPAAIDGAPATRVRLDALKPGVGDDDVFTVAGELGLHDIVLY